MSSQFFRRVLAGALVTSFLSLAGPLPSEAADAGAPAAPEELVLAWEWLMELVFPGGESSGSSTAAAADHETSDAGWVIDPDG